MPVRSATTNTILTKRSSGRSLLVPVSLRERSDTDRFCLDSINSSLRQRHETARSYPEGGRRRSDTRFHARLDSGVREALRACDRDRAFRRAAQSPSRECKGFFARQGDKGETSDFYNGHP